MAAQDGAAERQLRAGLIDFTRSLVQVPSSAAHPSAIERALELLRARLNPVEGVLIDEHRCEGVPSLVVRPAAVERPSILLVGHIDVVDHGTRRHYRSRVRDGRIYGPGAGDMKGAVAIMVTLFGDLLSRHPEVSLGLAITADEELGSQHGTRYLMDQGLTCDLAILPDGGSIDTVVVAEKGLLHVEVVWRGASTHGAYPWTGNNPVDGMLGDLARMRDRFAALASDRPDHWYPTATVTTLESESKSVNRVPEFARAGVDVRFTPPWTVATMLREVQSCLSPGAELSLPNTTECTRMEIDADYRNITEQVLGAPLQEMRTPGASDARFFSALGIPAILARPVVGNVHRVDEWVDIDSMLQFHQILNTFIHRRLHLS
jgi:succinyl-diaminopimelate desuccinylase